MKYVVFICFSLFSQIVYSQTYNLSISIPNLKNHNGEIQIGIYNKKENFPKVDKQFRLIYIKANKFTGVCTIKGLPQGEYAVALMHDENADKICNMNFLGIPKEGYGFSNNIRPIFSAPSFNDCKIDLNDNISITINLIY
jgi:uncharacterized protein (DUF2141 family)